MKPFMWNMVLALIWTAATGHFTVANLAVGFAAGYLVLWYAQGVIGRSTYFAKVGQLFGFLAFFLREFIRANFRVAYDVVTPTYHMRPGVIGIPLDAETDLEITLLATLITLTPGTLSLDVSDDRKVLYIHAMFIDDLETVQREIKDGFERRVLELLR